MHEYMHVFTDTCTHALQLLSTLYALLYPTQQSKFLITIYAVGLFNISLHTICNITVIHYCNGYHDQSF